MSLAHVLLIDTLTKLYQFIWTIGGACFYHVNWKFETFIFPDEQSHGYLQQQSTKAQQDNLSENYGVFVNGGICW